MPQRRLTARSFRVTVPLTDFVGPAARRRNRLAGSVGLARRGGGGRIGFPSWAGPRRGCRCDVRNGLPREDRHRANARCRRWHGGATAGGPDASRAHWGLGRLSAAAAAAAAAAVGAAVRGPPPGASGRCDRRGAAGGPRVVREVRAVAGRHRSPRGRPHDGRQRPRHQLRGQRSGHRCHRSLVGGAPRLAAITNDGLVGFRRAGGARGAELVPDWPPTCRHRPMAASPTPSTSARGFATPPGPRCWPETSGGVSSAPSRTPTTPRPTTPRRSSARRAARTRRRRPRTRQATAGLRPAGGDHRERPDRHYHLPPHATDAGVPIPAGPANASAVPQDTPLDLPQGTPVPATGPYMLRAFTRMPLTADGHPGSNWSATRTSTCGRPPRSPLAT